jgi:hypothetical protein
LLNMVAQARAGGSGTTITVAKEQPAP